MKNENENYIGYKIIIFPTNEQKKIFNEYFGLTRFVYNLAINIEKEYYEKNKKFMEYYQLDSELIKLKHNIEEYKWLVKYNCQTIREILKDAVNAYKRFFNTNNKYPRYKAKGKCKLQFPIRSDRFTIDKNKIRISSIGWVKYYNSYGNNIIGSSIPDRKDGLYKYIKYTNCRVSFDGINYYLSFTIPKDKDHNINSYKYYGSNIIWKEQESSDPIGIDVGFKRNKWLVDSTGNRIERPDSSKLNKKIKRLSRKYSRQLKQNLEKDSSYFEHHPKGSKNMQKTLVKINKCHKKIVNRRKNTVYEYCKGLLDKKPKAIVMETISIKNKVVHKNTKDYNTHKRNMNALIKDAALYNTMQIIEYKMKFNDIPVIYADANYPSSQLCSCCGYRQNIGRKKVYKCPICGTIIDRDINAAINLSKLAY